METSYWTRILGSRVRRRRALTASGALLTSAAFLAACGGDDEPTSGGPTGGGTTGGSTGGGSTGGATSTGATGGTSGLITEPVDTMAQAKQGGSLLHWADGDAVHFDALASNANGVINWISEFAYPRMLKYATVKYPEVPDDSLEGELASSYELSGDKLTLTFKVRPGMKWDARDPTNNRPIDAEDVMFSWNKFVELNQSAGNMSSQRSPSAPIESVEAPDSETIVMKMTQPDSSIVPLFASWDHFYIMPRESEGGFDPRQVVRGHGPWLLDQYEPSVKFSWARNPDYYQQGRPFPDRLERPIIPEYSARLAQFRSGAIHTNVALPIDITQTHRDLPGTNIIQNATFSTSIWHGMSFGYEDDSPFKDARVRQAASMLIDGNAYVDVIDNRELFAGDGLEIPTAFNSVVAAGWGDYWLDPEDQASFGEEAKYLAYDPEGAKQLLSAAGYPDGFDFNMYFSDGLYGPVYQESVQLYGGMLREGGLRATMNGFPYEQFKDIYYEAYYGPSYESGKTSGFNGVVVLANPSLPTVTSHLFTFVHRNGGRYHGMTPDGNNAQLGDPKLNADIDKLKLEFDRDRQITMVHDMIRYFTGQSYYIPRKGQTLLVELIWPAIQNYNLVARSPGDNEWAESKLHWWIDETKPPFT